ncbi:MAG TPA: Xaa-Pro peptidase family protein [Mariprofundaceae bacterium]|nr:Xaa-Pro peptidase family protein [Mariprofundaceae bacterium]
MTRKARLIIAGSEHHADMLYVSGMFVPDPFVAIEIDDQWHGLLSPLEVDRARKSSRLNHIHLDTPWRERASSHGWSEGLAGAAAAFLKEHDIRHITVPGDFPLMHAERLRHWGFEVEPSAGTLFPERAVKSEQEIAQLERAEQLTRKSMRAAERFLARSSIGDDEILRHPETGKRLKSKHLRSVIETFLVAHGAMPAHTIVACGREGADPHNVGHGHLRAHQPIIIDIFPRLLDCGYWGDMTRTYVKGRASSEVRKLYRTVREGQDIGLEMVTAGVHGADIHRAISRHFDAVGFTTGMQRGKQTGFFHGTGHGVGLDIHEAPRISVRDDILQENQVVTVEPGLYYPALGGVRLEDLVVVRKQGCDNLTRHPRRLEIA